MSDGAEIRSADEEQGVVSALLDGDELDFEVKQGVILFRSVRKEGFEFTPPFCLAPGCITGPSNRARLEALRDQLGYSNFETDEDKSWNQIFLH